MPNTERVQEYTLLLDLAVAAEIETNRASKRAASFRQKLESSHRKNADLLALAIKAENEAKLAARETKKAREYLEKCVWAVQDKINPNFGFPLTILNMSRLAADRVPENVTLISQLCVRCSLQDLCPPGMDKRPAHEISDLLRRLGSS